MRNQPGSRQPSGGPLLKTCQTCFKAKIRCQTTQASGACDRCSRLQKTCIFASSRRRPLTVPGPSSGQSDSDSPTPAAVGTHDPFSRGLLDVERAGPLFRRFRASMTPRFPFVVLPATDDGSGTEKETEGLQLLRRQRPFLCLAALAASCHDDFVLQRELSRLFNESLSARLATGNIRSLDVLQGLLVHLAWAHYHPRPRSYSQHLYLAASIVSDMRLDRRRNPQLWKVHLDPDDENNREWGPDELRALAGTYYLASSSSIVLLKMRHFPFSPFILDSCNKLTLQEDATSDRYIEHIVRIQRLAEEFDDILTHPVDQSLSKEGSVMSSLTVIRDRLDTFKSELTFPLGECPTLLLQLGMLELAICQQSLPGSPLSASAATHSQTAEVFSGSVLASKSLLNILITMTSGQEKALTNLEWISLSYALSFSARLDILMANPRIAHLTGHARRWLDFRHMLRQVILRLQPMISPRVDRNGDCDTFSQFLKRAEIVQVWYSRQTDSLLSTPSDGDANPPKESMVVERVDEALENGPDGSANLFMDDFFAEMQVADAWMPQSLGEFSLSWGD